MPKHDGICPFCKEEIKPDAVKCKHCKSILCPQIYKSDGKPLPPDFPLHKAEFSYPINLPCKRWILIPTNNCVEECRGDEACYDICSRTGIAPKCIEWGFSIDPSVLPRWFR